ncbi:MAG TPA: DUF4190 domain-containing protein [Ktedonobacterales bacterium]|jgi:hypothetical protein
MASRPPEYDPSQYPPYVPPEASQSSAQLSASLSDAPPFAPLSPEQAQASFAELVDPFAPVVSAQAIFSVITAIVFATLLPVFGQIISIILGARALRRIKASDGSIIGRRLAWFGIIFSVLCLLGYLALFALIVYGVLSLGALGAS